MSIFLVGSSFSLHLFDFRAPADVPAREQLNGPIFDKALSLHPFVQEIVTSWAIFGLYGLLHALSEPECLQPTLC